MSDFGDSELDRDERRRVAAAEYALGVTDGEARAAMERAMDASPALAAEVAHWERRLAAFNEDYLPATPSAGLLGHIEARLFAERDTRKPWYDSLLLWRALAGTAAAIAVLAVGLNLLAPSSLRRCSPSKATSALLPDTTRHRGPCASAERVRRPEAAMTTSSGSSKARMRRFPWASSRWARRKGWSWTRRCAIGWPRASPWP
jgi:hypothetical protein